LNILRAAQDQGYTLGVERDNTFTATNNGTVYLRSNHDIQRFGRLAKISPAASPVDDPETKVSFREPMSFPRGTTLYETKSGTRVAVLSDWSLIMECGEIGRIFKSVTDFRDYIEDQEHWKLLREF
jgi:hypothetical protein